MSVRDRAWVRTEPLEFPSLLPDGIDYVEAATEDLVASGFISMDRDVTWAALHFIIGATNVSYVDEADSTHEFRLTIDVEAVDQSLPPNIRPACMDFFGDVVDPSNVTDAEAIVRLDAEGRVVALHLTVGLAGEAGLAFVAQFNHQLD